MASANGPTRRKSCFILEEEDDYDDGILEPGFSRSVCCSSSSAQRRTGSRSVVNGRYCVYNHWVDGARFDDHSQQPHFLDSCSLCRKPLGNRDIFMYRGNIPFCSEECRQEQIDMDEYKEKSWNLSASMKALRKKDQRRSVSPNKGYSLHTNTVAAA